MKFDANIVGLCLVGLMYGACGVLAFCSGSSEPPKEIKVEPAPIIQKFDVEGHTYLAIKVGTAQRIIHSEKCGKCLRQVQEIIKMKEDALKESMELFKKCN